LAQSLSPRSLGYGFVPVSSLRCLSGRKCRNVTPCPSLPAMQCKRPAPTRLACGLNSRWRARRQAGGVALGGGRAGAAALALHLARLRAQPQPQRRARRGGPARARRQGRAARARRGAGARARPRPRPARRGGGGWRGAERGSGAGGAGGGGGRRRGRPRDAAGRGRAARGGGRRQRQARTPQARGRCAWLYAATPCRWRARREQQRGQEHAGARAHAWLVKAPLLPGMLPCAVQQTGCPPQHSHPGGCCVRGA